MQELDRVLGGGGVRGSLILVGGAPGIGKSTLLLQICAYLGKTLRILYVSGEESEKQIKMRADRLQVASDELYILSETDLSEILSAVDEVQPDILIADSIQTLYSPENTSAPGSISQVKDCTMALMQLAKSSGVTVFVVGHVNKEGAIAGAEGARAHGRLRAVFRGRARQQLPHPARGQKPLRLDKRDRRVRDGGQGTARGPEPVRKCCWPDGH